MQHLQKTRGRGGPFFPFWNSPLVSHPCIQALSFHALTHCPFCNSSLFPHMHLMGGCTPPTTPAARSFTTVNSRCSYDFPPVTSHQLPPCPRSVCYPRLSAGGSPAHPASEVVMNKTLKIVLIVV